MKNARPGFTSVWRKHFRGWVMESDIESSIRSCLEMTMKIILKQHFNEGVKVIERAKLHSRTYGPIKAWLLKLSRFRNKKASQI